MLLHRLEDLDFHLDCITIPEFLHYACIICVCRHACMPFSFEILVLEIVKSTLFLRDKVWPPV